MSAPCFPLARFETSLRTLSDPVTTFREGIIGADMMIDTHQGTRKLVYADYVASGRALRQIEEFVMTEVLPYYANSHTEQSFCGARMTQMREEARRVIAAKCNAGPEHAVIFGGSGATTGINQLVHLFGVRAALTHGRPVHILVGPYEHHSNLLPWRECGAEVHEIEEAAEGGPNLTHLQETLASCPKNALIIGAFSAMANVTGVLTDTGPTSRILKSHGALTLWDYAGGAPYLPIDLSDPNIDAIVTSPHKFIGGPGASGVLIVRRDMVSATTPHRPGGGTVAFVNAHQHDYVPRLEQREEGGTPNVIGDIRAALAFIVKDVIGQDYITKRNTALVARAFAAWQDHPQIELLAANRPNRVPVLSFVPRTAQGHRIDYQTFTRDLSDHFGIQARGGCSCAGPYVHALLQIDDTWSQSIRTGILAGDTSEKPGFVRLNLSYLMSDETVDFILSAIPALLDKSGTRAA